MNNPKLHVKDALGILHQITAAREDEGANYFAFQDTTPTLALDYSVVGAAEANTLLVALIHNLTNMQVQDEWLASLEAMVNEAAQMHYALTKLRESIYREVQRFMPADSPSLDVVGLANRTSFSYLLTEVALHDMSPLQLACKLIYQQLGRIALESDL